MAEMGHFKNNLTGEEKLLQHEMFFFFFLGQRAAARCDQERAVVFFFFCFKVSASSTFGWPQSEAGHAAGNKPRLSALNKTNYTTAKCQYSMFHTGPTAKTAQYCVILQNSIIAKS